MMSPLLLPPLASWTAAATVATLAMSSVCNMWQTREILIMKINDSSSSPVINDNGIHRTMDLNLKSATPLSSSSSSSSSHDSTGSSSSAVSSSFPYHWNSREECLSALQTMNRKQLLELFLHHSKAPMITAGDYDDASSDVPHDVLLQGNWNGLLLDNNGIVMTKVTSFITHQLFGRGQTWNGKSFSNDSNQPQGWGWNRFRTTRSSSDSVPREKDDDVGIPPSSKQQDHDSEPDHRHTHRFDATIMPSTLDPTQQPSLTLQYTNYQSPWSLWRTMTDELRVIPIPLLSSKRQDEEEKGPHVDSSSSNSSTSCHHSNGVVMIGVGWMAWSGGKWNASPFCLWRDDA